MRSTGELQDQVDGRFLMPSEHFDLYLKELITGQQKAVNIAYLKLYGTENPLKDKVAGMPSAAKANSTLSTENFLLVGASWCLLSHLVPFLPRRFGPTNGFQYLFLCFGLLPLVVVLHELGHYLAGYSIGLKNLKVTFYKDFSGLTTYSLDPKVNSPWGKYYFTIMGSLPSLIIAALIHIVLRNSKPNGFTLDLTVLSHVLLFLNMTSLIPTYFFDGAILLRIIFLRIRLQTLLALIALCFFLAFILISGPLKILGIIFYLLTPIFSFAAYVTRFDRNYATSRQLPLFPNSTTAATVIQGSILLLYNFLPISVPSRLAMLLIYCTLLTTPALWALY